VGRPSLSLISISHSLDLLLHIFFFHDRITLYEVGVIFRCFDIIAPRNISLIIDLKDRGNGEAGMTALPKPKSRRRSRKAAEPFHHPCRIETNRFSPPIRRSAETGESAVS